MFITFEGTEGAGKSTQIKSLCDYLRSKNKKVLQTVEPGGTGLGAEIRDLLLHTRYPATPEAETLLYMASRAQLVEEVLRPALKARKIVICDRWLDATVAYQGYGSGVDVRWIEKLGREIAQGLTPDLTFFLDLPVKTGLVRARKRGIPDRIESRAETFHRRVYAGYCALAKRHHRRFCRISVTTVEETQAMIRRRVDHVL